jgi:hypothetical protein
MKFRRLKKDEVIEGDGRFGRFYWVVVNGRFKEPEIGRVYRDGFYLTASDEPVERCTEYWTEYFIGDEIERPSVEIDTNPNEEG